MCGYDPTPDALVQKWMAEAAQRKREETKRKINKVVFRGGENKC